MKTFLISKTDPTSLTCSQKPLSTFHTFLFGSRGNSFYCENVLISCALIPNIDVHVLPTVFYKFLIVLVGRICLDINTFHLHFLCSNYPAPVVQRADNSSQWINRYPVDKMYSNQYIFMYWIVVWSLNNFVVGCMFDQVVSDNLLRKSIGEIAHVLATLGAERVN